MRLIDHENNQKGVLLIEQARDLANQIGLDLVEISPDSTPPVCKILDYGKYKYEAQKRKNEARKKILQNCFEKIFSNR